MSHTDDELPPDVSPPARRRRERRRQAREQPPRVDPKEVGTITHDDLGNAVWNWRVDVPRRREEDPTIDLLECLDVDELALEDDDDDNGSSGSFDPYDKTR